MIVLDASILIAYLDAADAHHRAALDLLTRSIDEDLTTSPLTLAEVLVRPARTGQLETARRVLDELGVSTTPFPDDTPARLAMTRAETGLKMPDCCVILIAEITSGRIATFDDQLTAAARLRGLPTSGRD